MNEEKQQQKIVFAIIANGTKREKEQALRYLRSFSARAEADIVDASRLAQNEIIAAVTKTKPEAIKKYETRKLLLRINTMLGKLISEVERLARKLVVANIISGKIKSALDASIAKDELVKRISITGLDRSRIDKIVMDIVTRVRNGVSLTAASLNNSLQKISIQANMPRPASVNKKQNPIATNSLLEKKHETGQKKQTTDNKPAVKQNPIPREFGETVIIPKVRVKTTSDKAVTDSELKAISRNPASFVSKFSSDTIKHIAFMRRQYAKEAYDKRVSQTSKHSQPKGMNDKSDAVVSAFCDTLKKEGLFAFSDKGGKRWTLMHYCSMLARTTSTQSANIGDLYADSEHDLYYIVPHSHSCPICHKVEGKVYSRSGLNKKYPPLASVFPKIDPAGSDDLSNRYFSIHPNCRHLIVKYNGK